MWGLSGRPHTPSDITLSKNIFVVYYKISYSGFVIPESGELFVAKPEKFNYSTTIEVIRDFLSAHPVPKGKKYALVMDNAPWHKKTKRLIVNAVNIFTLTRLK